MRRFVYYLVIGALIWATPALATSIDVVVPVKSRVDATQEYPFALLKFVLDKSGVKYTITLTDVGVTTQARDVFRLKSNQGINLGWFGTSPELERDLIPIRFPIWRGLLGYRVFIINKDKQDAFDHVNTLEDLQRFTGAQGIGWTDIQILEHSGLKQEASAYDLIFAKINTGRADYFSRGITEAFREVKARQKEFPNLVVERHVLLVYPFDGFFFTNKENPELARALEDGFRKSYADGSFKKFFYSHPAVKAVLDKANTNGRKRINIPNPLLTPETQAIPDVYWHSR